METLILEKDIRVFYITATSFPEGIIDATQRLHALIPFSKNRKYFGISRPENGVIVYRSAAEELHKGEAETLACDTLTLKKGKYIGLTIKNYAKDMLSIDRAFKQLLAYPHLDPKGYCVEWYINETDVTCMIRTAE